MGEPGERPHIAKLIDSLLAAEKALAGNPGWQPGNRPGELRWDWPVLVEGESANCQVSVTAYPEDYPNRFTITLNYVGRCIWRLDYEPDYKAHINPPDRAPFLGDYTIWGRHYHSWADNRHLATPANPPRILDCARALPSNIQNWENAFRWFCGETRITQSGAVPDLPIPVRLL